MSRIAVLGWGSLIWQPRNRYGEIHLTGPWRRDGPELPVEFARISADGRLTLVVVPAAAHRVPVLWATSRHRRPAEAIANLARRETQAPPEAIHGVGDGRTYGRPDADVAAAVRAWMQDRPLDVTLWTGLPPGRRWREHGYQGYSPSAALDYFAGLDGGLRRRAEEYVSRAPEQIDTPLRRALTRSIDARRQH